MKQLFFAGFSAFIAICAHAEIVVQPIAAGTAATRGLTQTGYCKNVYIKKIGDNWAVVPEKEADLKDDKVEKLQGCLASTTKGPVDAMVFSLATRDTCTTFTQCLAPMIGPLNGGCTNRTSYSSSAPRGNGYYSCNSNFANRTGMFKKLQFDAPIDLSLLASALASDAIKTDSNAFAQAQYARAVASAVDGEPTTCGSCQRETDAMRAFFTHFASYATPDEVNAPVRKYIVMTGNRQLPTWMSANLSPAAAEMLMAQGEQEWRRRYSEEITSAIAPDSSNREIEQLIDRLQKAGANNWKSVDFDGRVPQLQALLQKRAQDAAQGAERQRQAEAKTIAAWRKALQVGSDTFCGAVIEVRKPMIKIAVNTQLAGFGNEAWIKASDAYPPQYGCRNVNGRLSIY